jgi:hypothetical protein
LDGGCAIGDVPSLEAPSGLRRRSGERRHDGLVSVRWLWCLDRKTRSC